MRTVIFDLDGTLADTSGDLVAAANACFEHLGLGAPLDPVADATTAFHGGRAMLQLGFERTMPGWRAADIDAQYPLFLTAYRDQIDVFTTLYPGAVAAVSRLRGAGFAVGICTNKPAALAELLLRRLGIRSLFASMIGADTLPTRKPDPAPLRAAISIAGGSPRRAMLLGDTLTDVKTGHAAGVPCALVTFGPDGRGVAALAPDALLDHYDALDDLTARLIPA